MNQDELKNVGGDGQLPEPKEPKKPAVEGPRGSYRKDTPARKLKARQRAMTLLEVLEQTGRLDLIEAHRRCFPNQSEESHKNSAERDMWAPEVYREFLSLLKLGDDTVKNFKPLQLVKGILEDILVIDTMIKTYDVDTDQLTKLMNSKSQKQKMLGAYLGMWESDPADRKPPKEDPHQVFAKLNAFLRNSTTKGVGDGAEEKKEAEAGS